jgi:CheY-like chemotaxis protein
MTVRILLVEDEIGSAILVQEALRETGLDHTLELASDGEAAMSILRNGRLLPHLVLLDLNLPRKSGLEVLQDVKGDPDLRVIPVVMLTNSHSAEDIRAAYAAQCNAFLKKRTLFEELVEALRISAKFWFQEVLLPG